MRKPQIHERQIRCPSISLNSFLGRLASFGREAQKPPPKPEILFCQVARSTFSGSDGTPMGSGCVTPVQLAPVGAPRCEEIVILFIVSITRIHRTQSKRQNRQAVAVKVLVMGGDRLWLFALFGFGVEGCRSRVWVVLIPKSMPDIGKAQLQPAGGTGDHTGAYGPEAQT